MLMQWPWSPPIKETTRARIFIARPTEKKTTESASQTTTPPQTIEEAAKAIVLPDQQKISKDIGVDHPVDFDLLEKIYLGVPIVAASINKTVDVTVSTDFHIKSQNQAAKEAIEEFILQHNFDMLFRNIVKDMLIFGNAFVEIVYDNTTQQITQLKPIDPKTMYVKRNATGEVEGYTQYTGKAGQQKIDFTPGEIAHYAYNIIGDRAYGCSIITPVIKIIENRLNMEKSMMTLMARKANAPLVVTMGNEKDGPPREEDLQDMANDLQYMDEKTEYVVSYQTKIEALDVGGKIFNFGPFLEYFENQVVYAMETPVVLLGRGNIPEGLGITQLEAYYRRTGSIRLLLENVTEKKIFKRILDAQGIQDAVEIDWEPQTDEDRWKEIEKVMGVMQSSAISEPTRKALEVKLLGLMGIEGITPEDLQPQTSPTDQTEFKKKPANIYEVYEQYPLPPEQDLDLTVEAWTYRSSSPIWKQIERFLHAYYFDDITDFTHDQKNQLKTALLQGMKKNVTLRTLTQDIAKITGDKTRAEKIARTETVRATSNGLLEDYKDAGIKEYRWITIGDSRLCPHCTELQGRKFSVDNPGPLPPYHPLCRCTIAAVI